MTIVRIIFAVLITLSLTFAPGVAGAAVMQGHAAPMADTSADHMQMADTQMADTQMADTTMSADMTDCMKAMSGSANEAPKGACKCCDTKSKCPDTAGCMSKCCKVLGALKPASKVIGLTIVQYHQTERAKPPNWVSIPPAPPPRS